MQKTAAVVVVCFLLTQQYLLSGWGFNKPPSGGLAGTWQEFRQRELTADERNDIAKFRELPASEAIPALSWLITGYHVQNAEAVQLARETILAIPGWANFLQAELARVGYPKTPVELFGPDWNVLFRRKINDTSLPERERVIAAYKLSDKIRESAEAVSIARRSQTQILELAAVLDRPESVLLVAPYLFDTSPAFKFSPDQWEAGIRVFATGGFQRMSVPGKPARLAPKDQNEITVREYIKAWREWWLRHARDYGATPPPSIDATPAEVAALNAPALASVATLNAKAQNGGVVVPPTPDAPQAMLEKKPESAAKADADAATLPTMQTAWKIWTGVAIAAVLSAVVFALRRRKS